MRKGYRYYGAVWMSAFCLVCLSGCGQRTAVAGNPGIGTGINSSVAADGGSEAGNGRDTGAGGSEAGADRNTGDAGLKPGQAPADTAVLSGDARTERFEILDADDDGMLVCGAGSNGMSGLFRVGRRRWKIRPDIGTEIRHDSGTELGGICTGKLSGTVQLSKTQDNTRKGKQGVGVL